MHNLEGYKKSQKKNYFQIQEIQAYNQFAPFFQIDDPLDAIPVHGGGGIWGTLAVYLFKWDGILSSWTAEAALGLAWNIVGLFAIVSWTGITCFFMFYILKKMGQLRVAPEHEFKGKSYIYRPRQPNWDDLY